MRTKILLFALILATVLPCTVQAAPSLPNGIFSSDDPINVNVTTEKKKEVIEINPNFFAGIAIDIVTVILIILCVYYPNYKKMDTIFTFILFNITIFLLTFVLNKVKLSMGAAFGLFAVFSMLRYRTSGISMKDMTYLFIFIAVGLISAIQMELWDLAVICGIIFVTTLLLDSKFVIKRESTKMVLFEKVEMIKPEFSADLLNELKNRTGLNIRRFDVNELNYMKDTASITIYYYE
jgi:cytochrome c biogenesis factor